MNKWPNEVQELFSSTTHGIRLNPQNAEKIKAHINRLWLAETPTDKIIREVIILAKALEDDVCAK
ncbi:hypothetical protein CG651_001226 [Salmonella enterica]|nr:hypothetical protein [Salmonella enterica]